jgi:hypothetical protein
MGEVNIDATDGRGLQIKPLRWSQMPFSNVCKDWLKYSNIISGDTDTDTQTASSSRKNTSIFPKEENTLMTKIPLDSESVRRC